ncbi:Paired box domain-containing protein [Ditylenchus destructor]|uniref:Paired box domain-containing protein n=1 Tax=Ditylenchus destructor TaxID=166010 RepID=A0AAD4MLM8_9BILA|nr:Paired box domain-containing protein [Ditylenchus destructor]
MTQIPLHLTETEAQQNRDRIISLCEQQPQPAAESHVDFPATSSSLPTLTPNPYTHLSALYGSALQAQTSASSALLSAAFAASSGAFNQFQAQQSQQVLPGLWQFPLTGLPALGSEANFSQQALVSDKSNPQMTLERSSELETQANAESPGSAMDIENETGMRNDISSTTSAMSPRRAMSPTQAMVAEMEAQLNAISKNKLGRTYNPGRPLGMVDRRRILHLYQKGFKISHIAKLIGVTHSCVSKIMTRYRRTGSMSPKCAQNKKASTSSAPGSHAAAQGLPSSGKRSNSQAMHAGMNPWLSLASHPMFQTPSGSPIWPHSVLNPNFANIGMGSPTKAPKEEQMQSPNLFRF